jgi:hypothetical protein
MNSMGKRLEKLKFLSWSGNSLFLMECTQKELTS